jgi:branched-chain amino acid transport system permease protein
LGYNVRAYKLAAFVIAAAFAALAGVINGQFSLFASPESAHWTQSASVLVMVLIGGAGTKTGPVIGAALVLLLQHWLSSYTQYWSLALGLLFIVLITTARDGIHGLLLRLWVFAGARR